MDPLIVGLLMIILLLLLISLSVDIGIALITVALVGLMLIGVKGVVEYVGSSVFAVTFVYEFVALPLFILMSAFAVRAGIAESAYDAVQKWVQKLPGALAVSTTLGCAMFGAVSGSSMATSAVFGRVSYPLMVKNGYDKKLALGSIAAAGTFACMIPPSTLFIVYAIYTDTSVGHLFMAGVIPGLLTALTYIALIIIRAKLNPKLAPMQIEKSYNWKEKFASLRSTSGLITLAVVVLGGIYLGFCTVTEGAALGCIGAMIIGLLSKGIHSFEMSTALRETARTTSMVFLIIIGAMFFARFLAATRLPWYVFDILVNWYIPPWLVIASIFTLLFLLGMFISPGGIMAITIPVFFPVVIDLGYDPVWFGVIMMKANEIAAVTPPVGLNVYVLKGVVGRNVKLEEVFAGIWPFVGCDLFILIFLILFPQISLWLPSIMLG